MGDRPKLKSLEKTFQMPECFTGGQPGLGISGISKRLGLYKSNIHTILTTLESMGHIKQDGNHGKYYQSRKFIKFSHGASGFKNGCAAACVESALQRKKLQPIRTNDRKTW